MNGQQSQKVSMNGLPYHNNKYYYKYKHHNSSHKNICTNIHPRILNVPGSRQNKISPSVKSNKMRYKFNELILEQQKFVNLILPEWFK